LKGSSKTARSSFPASSKDQKQEIASMIIEFGTSCGKEGE